MSCAFKSTSDAGPTTSAPATNGRRCEPGPAGTKRTGCPPCGVYAVSAAEFARMLDEESDDPAVRAMFIAMCCRTGETLEAYVARVHPALSPIERHEMFWHMWFERREIARRILSRFGDNATTIAVNA